MPRQSYAEVIADGEHAVAVAVVYLMLLGLVLFGLVRYHPETDYGPARRANVTTTVTR